MTASALSGYLAEPSGRVPILGNVELFKQKPYLLPGLALFSVSIVSAFAVFVFVPEVRPDLMFKQLQADFRDKPCTPGSERGRRFRCSKYQAVV
jgi:hypothetical protein